MQGDPEWATDREWYKRRIKELEDALKKIRECDEDGLFWFDGGWISLDTIIDQALEGSAAARREGA